MVIFCNDHGLNFFLDKMPTFAVGAAPQYVNSDEGCDIPSLEPLKGEVDLSWHIINTRIDKEFDLQFIESLLTNPEWATQFRIRELVDKTGTQGVELLMWLAMRAALTTCAGKDRLIPCRSRAPVGGVAPRADQQWHVVVLVGVGHAKVQIHPVQKIGLW